jgi:hypothetical protein
VLGIKEDGKPLDLRNFIESETIAKFSSRLVSST